MRGKGFGEAVRRDISGALSRGRCGSAQTTMSSK